MDYTYDEEKILEEMQRRSLRGRVLPTDPAFTDDVVRRMGPLGEANRGHIDPDKIHWEEAKNPTPYGATNNHATETQGYPYMPDAEDSWSTQWRDLEPRHMDVFGPGGTEDMGVYAHEVRHLIGGQNFPESRNRLHDMLSARNQEDYDKMADIWVEHEKASGRPDMTRKDMDDYIKDYFSDDKRTRTVTDWEHEHGARPPIGLRASSGLSKGATKDDYLGYIKKNAWLLNRE